MFTCYTWNLKKSRGSIWSLLLSPSKTSTLYFPLPCLEAARICACGLAVSCALWCCEAAPSCSELGVLCLLPVHSSSADFQNYLFSLCVALTLAVQPGLLGWKAEVKKSSIPWDVVLRCELWSSGWMFTRSPVVSLCAVQSIVHF